MHLCSYVFLAIDAVLPSNNDVMKNRSFVFQKNMRGRKKNTPVPGIRIPMGAVQKQFMKRG